MENILHLVNGKPLEEKYGGQGSCPLTTSLGTEMLAEFSYGGNITPDLMAVTLSLRGEP